MTLRQLVLDDLWSGITRIRTATELNDTFNYFKPQTKLSSVSSVCNKLVRDGLLLRVKGFGPRGGYGYLINPHRRDDVAVILGKKPAHVIVFDNPVAQRYFDHAGWQEK